LDPNSSSEWLTEDSRGAIDAWVQTDSKPVLSLFPLRAGVPPAPDDVLETTGVLTFSRSVRLCHARKGKFAEPHPMRAIVCLLREKSLQTTNKQQNEGGSLYV
jgi:hypothetical protein